MIPIKLALRNFMCYRDNVSPLDFEGIHVACLSGDNGNGKSAILDAITWALWGQARAKSDDDLIHTGQSEMEVEFEFDVADVGYRVLRKRARPRTGKAGQTMLELHLRSNGAFQPITGNTVRDTQRKITEILRMDYPTFTNSAFLLQGHADEFTVKIPSERKKVLAEILGLSLYDQFEERARSRAREAEKEESILDSAIKDIDAELAHKSEYQNEFDGMASVLAILEKDAKDQETEVSGLRQAKKGLEDKKAQLTEIERRAAEAQRELVEAEKQATAHGQKVQEYEARLSQGEEVRVGYADLASARKEHERLGVIQAQLLEIRRQKAELEQKIAVAKGKLVTEQRVLQNSIAQNEAKAKALPSSEEDLAKVRLQANQLDAQEAELAQENDRLSAVLAQLLDIGRSKGELEHRVEAAKSELVAQQRVLMSNVGQNEAKAKALSSLEDELARARLCLDELALQETDLKDKKEKAQQLSIRIHSLKSGGTQLQEEMKALREKLTLLAQGETTCPLCETELGETGRQNIEDKYRADERAKAETYAADQKELAGRVTEYNILQREADSVEVKLRKGRDAAHARLATLSRDVQEAKSAAEKMALDRKRLAEVTAKLEKREFAPEDRIALDELAQREAQLAYDVEGHQKVRQRLGEAGKEREAAHARLATLSRDVQEAKSAAERMVLEKDRLGEVETSLAKGDFAAVEQAALLELADQEAKLGYDPAGFQRLRDRLAGLEKFNPLFQKLDEAERLLPQEKEALQRAESGIGRWRSALEKETQLQKDLSLELASLPAVTARLRSAEETLQGVQARLARGREGLGAMREKLAHCAKLEVDRREKTAALNKIAREKSIYDELAVAFGKKGIQALIIEAALPEIEEEANSLLARMTDNRMHVKIETQRDTRKGDTIETLDIKISDELGTRSYEMFSGGEAFRINFALRIALSKLLARRAGAPLPTLVIDEGFGTQDSAGRYKLVEAINSIQDDFKRIIVVTHIEELKEAFPVRIDVTKTEEGSTFSVSVV